MQFARYLFSNIEYLSIFIIFSIFENVKTKCYRVYRYFEKRWLEKGGQKDVAAGNRWDLEIHIDFLNPTE